MRKTLISFLLQEGPLRGARKWKKTWTWTWTSDMEKDRSSSFGKY